MNRYKTRSKNGVTLVVGLRTVPGGIVAYAETLTGSQVYVSEPYAFSADPDDVLTLVAAHVGRMEVGLDVARATGFVLLLCMCDQAYVRPTRSQVAWVCPACGVDGASRVLCSTPGPSRDKVGVNEFRILTDTQ